MAKFKVILPLILGFIITLALSYVPFWDGWRGASYGLPSETSHIYAPPSQCYTTPSHPSCPSIPDDVTYYWTGYLVDFIFWSAILYLLFYYTPLYLKKVKR